MTSSPDSSAVRQQLERILASDAFSGAGRHTRVLRYLVERTLAGEGDQLKEYVVGTEAFDRDASYDPRLDSIVRVEVRRLRTRLEDYYRGAGAADPVVISIPRGSYVPTFTERTSSIAVIAGGDASGEPRGAAPRASFAVIAAAVVVAVALIVGTLAVSSNRRPGAEAASGPAVAVLLFEDYSADQRGANVAAYLTDAVTAELARLGTVSVTSRTTAVQYDSTALPVGEIAKTLDVDFLVEGSAVLSGNDLRVVARLVDGVRDRKVWVGEYDILASEVPEVAKQIAAEAGAEALRYASR